MIAPPFMAKQIQAAMKGEISVVGIEIGDLGVLVYLGVLLKYT